MEKSDSDRHAWRGHLKRAHFLTLKFSLCLPIGTLKLIVSITDTLAE